MGVAPGCRFDTTSPEFARVQALFEQGRPDEAYPILTRLRREKWRAITREDPSERAVVLYSAGDGVRGIASTLNVTYRQARRLLLASGVKLRPPHKWKARTR